MIRYTKEWDKLKPENIIVGKQFTTVRKYTPEKWAYYKEEVGKVHNQVLRAKTLGYAKILGVGLIDSSQLTIEFIRSDTFSHYDIEKFRDDLYGFYGRRELPLILITLEWTKIGI